jgi:hypothetical protein
MSDNPVNRKGSRHIDTHKYFIGQLVQVKLIELSPCVTDLMVTDVLTKQLKHKVEMLGMGTKVYSPCACSVMIYKCHIC